MSTFLRAAARDRKGNLKQLSMRDHVAISACVAPALGIGMFLLATRFGMSALVVVALIFGSAGVFTCLGYFFDPRDGFVIRGLAVNACFCVSLMLALWFTTGHPAVLMWVVFATAATTGGITVICTQPRRLAVSARSLNETSM